MKHLLRDVFGRTLGGDPVPGLDATPEAVRRAPLNQFRDADGDGVEIGTAGSDGLWGLVGDDRLVARGGDDFLYGGGGSDRMSGGAGDDLMIGGSGVDQMRGGAGADTMKGGGGGDRLFGGGGADRLVGGGGGDAIFGRAGADRLFGGRGDDTLTGDAGDDVLKGGRGADLFQFDKRKLRDGDADVVRDFRPDEGDRLGFSGFAAGDLTLRTEGGSAIITLRLASGAAEIRFAGTDADDIRAAAPAFFGESARQAATAVHRRAGA